MDGWESRRRRVPGHDWCIVQLGMRGIVHGVNVDTSHFTGNFPSHCSIEAVDMPAGVKPALHAVEGAPWITLLEKAALRGNGDNFFPISDRRPWTHLRLSIYPDGGVARLRVYGEVAVDWARVAPKGRVVDLASITNGGLFLDASDTHYGTRGALDHARPREEHGRRMGDETPPRSRSRLGDRPAWRDRASCRKSRSTPITSRATIRIARRSRGAWRRARRSIVLRTASWSVIIARDEAVRQQAPLLFRQAAQSDRRRLARAPEHLSRRRRQPPAHSWHACASLTRRRPTWRARSCRARADRPGGSIA